MPVIAMNQEMGSLGKDVAEALAAKLGLSHICHEVVDHVADKMHARRSLIRRVTEGKAGMLTRMSVDSRSVATYAAEEVFNFAAKGNTIIRGWGATYLLRAIPHIPCIRVCAPLDCRVEWLMKRLDTGDEDLVRQELRRSDAAHTRNMQARFGATWGDPLCYDLVLNTERVSVAGCVEQIKSLLALPEFQETAVSHQKLEDAALESQVRAALKSTPETVQVHVSIRADRGRLLLEGIVVDDSERKGAEKIAKSVKGVVSVDNRLKLLSGRMTNGE
jgi:cytidylate kinase